MNLLNIEHLKGTKSVSTNLKWGFKLHLMDLEGLKKKEKNPSLLETKTEYFEREKERYSLKSWTFSCKRGVRHFSAYIFF